MAQDGECIKEDFLLIAENPFPETLAPELPDRTTDCCNAFKLKALAYVADDDDLKNDRHGFLWFFQPVISTVELVLEKMVGSQYVPQDTLDDSTYGTPFLYGFFTNGLGEIAAGYQLEWREVLIAFGPGMYRVAVNQTANIGAPPLEGTFYSREFCLYPYTPTNANGTVRIEYNISGILGRADDDKKKRDYGTLDWYNALRLPGFFGYPTAEYETSYTDFNDGSRPEVEDTQEPEYQLRLYAVPAFVHAWMRLDVMMANTIAITDYNAKNAETFVQKYVQKAGGYAPDWKRMQSKLAPITIKFRQRWNNLRRLRF